MRYLPFVALLAALPAQEPFKARQFLPNDYHNVVHVNLVQLRETGIWDELETGMLKVMLGQLEKEAGFSLESLDRMTLVPYAPKPEPEGGGMSSGQQQVLVFEGNADLGVPDRVARNTSYADEMIGEYEVKRRDDWSDEVFFRPRPEVQIYGSTELLRPVLEGKPSAGMPCADILSLLSDRGDGLLFYFVINLADEALNERPLKMMFPDAEWPVDDRPQYMMLRLAAIGDPDDPHIEAEAVLRHAKAGEGMAITDKAVDALLEKALKVPQLRMVVPLLETGVRTHDRTDLSIKWDLGRARTASGNLAMLVLPMMTMGTTVEQVQAVEAAPADPPPPVPSAKKAGPKK